MRQPNGHRCSPIHRQSGYGVDKARSSEPSQMEKRMKKGDALLTRRSFINGSIGAASSVLLLKSVLAPSVPEAAAAEALTAPTYESTYLTADEWAFIHSAVNRLMPSNSDRR